MGWDRIFAAFKWNAAGREVRDGLSVFAALLVFCCNFGVEE